MTLDNLDNSTWLDGSFVSNKEAKTDIADHSLHYSGAVFEGIRAYNGQPFKLIEHYERFLQSAQLMGYQVPYSVPFLCAVTQDLIKINKLSNAYIRPITWRGNETMQIKGASCKIHTAIIAFDPFSGNQWSNRSLKLEVSSWKKIPGNAVPFSSKASALYMMATIIQNKAVNNGFDDALVLDQENYITEATTSNFFFLKNNVLYTPVADSFLNGITRQTVINEISPSLKLKVIEDRLRITDLEGAEAAFITGTAAGITAIQEIFDHLGSKTYRFNSDNPLLIRIMDAYDRLVGAILD